MPHNPPQQTPLPEPRADQPATPKAAPRPSRPTGSNDPERFMPTPEELERQVRHRSLGRTITDICLDLAVMPGLCTAAFWNEVFHLMHYLGGSVVTVMREKTRRQNAFMQEQDRIPDSNWDWLHLKRDAIRQALGFLIGEPPVDPLAQSTGPP